MPQSISNILKQNLKRPLIVASIGGNFSLIDSATKAYRDGANLIEIRMDTLTVKKINNIVNIVTQIKRSVPLPLIATLRSTSEQEPGKRMFRLTESERKSVYKTVIPHVEFIDVELGADKINSPLIESAHRLKKQVILSYHNFNSAPSDKKIIGLSEKYSALKGDILKIAVTPKDESDLARLMILCLKLKKKNRIFIAMGAMGLPSRILGFSFGSCMTYGSVYQAMAPGQISMKELVHYHGIIYPTKIKK